MGFQTGNGPHPKEAGIKYHKVHIYRLLYRLAFLPQVPQKMFITSASRKEKKDFKNKTS